MIDDFWTYAKGLYSHDHIKTQCLQLEEEYEANTTLILWLCWLDSHNIYLSPSALTDAQALTNSTGAEVRQQLNAARQLLQNEPQFTRVQAQSINKHMLAAELAIEKVLIQRLQDLPHKLPKLEKEEEHLSLFNYLDEQRVIYSGQISALLLEQARLYYEAKTERLILATG